MNLLSLARRLDLVGLHYAWVMVGVTFLTALATAGAVGTPGILIRPLEAEFGWPTAGISVALSLRLLLFGLMGPFAAALMNRYGLRRVVTMALAMVIAGQLLSLQMTTLWELVLFWGVIVGIGTGMTAQVLSVTVATRWFVRHRGLAVGILTASNAAGQLIFLPILAEVVPLFGWRGSMTFIVLALCFVWTTVVLFMHDHPGELGLSALGEISEKKPKACPQPPVAAGSPIAVAFRTLADASRTRVFWVLFLTFYVCGASTNGLIQTHFIPFCIDMNISTKVAAWTLAAMGIFDVVGTILSGWLSDRFRSEILLFWYYGLRGLSLLYLPFSDFSFFGLSLFAVFYGLDWVATVPPTVRLIAENFGSERTGIVFAWVMAGHQMGAASIAFAAGLSRSALETYIPAFLAAGFLCLSAAILVLSIQHRRPDDAPVAPAGAAPRAAG